MSAPRGWIGVDLDGTLAHYEGWKGCTHIGEPIPEMVERVRRWLAEGHTVRIFTARVSTDGSDHRNAEVQQARAAIQQWCREQFGRPLIVTNVKDWQMRELWDDRAVTVEQNTGRVLGRSQRRFS